MGECPNAVEDMVVLFAKLRPQVLVLLSQQLELGTVTRANAVFHGGCCEDAFGLVPGARGTGLLSATLQQNVRQVGKKTMDSKQIR